MSTPVPDFNKEPWKHPAVWKAHVVRNTLGEFDSETCAVANCECGWKFRAKISDKGARDVATFEHWRGVIAAAEVAPA